jgi:hypothetical protein
MFTYKAKVMKTFQKTGGLKTVLKNYWSEKSLRRTKMCRDLREANLDSFIGYKVVVKANGQYVSPATGYVYPEVGDLPEDIVPIKDICGPTEYGWDRSIACHWSYFFEPKMQGRTGVFKHFNVARKLLQSCRNYRWGHIWVIIKARVTNTILVGQMHGYGTVYAGKTIEVLEELTDE